MPLENVAGSARFLVAATAAVATLVANREPAAGSLDAICWISAAAARSIFHPIRGSGFTRPSPPIAGRL
jgi:hypothetical protein